MAGEKTLTLLALAALCPGSDERRQAETPVTRLAAGVYLDRRLRGLRDRGYIDSASLDSMRITAKGRALLEANPEWTRT